MTTTSAFAVVVGSYLSTEDARVDLSHLDDLFYESRLSAYDAALIVTDAWGQVRVEAHTSSSDLLVGPVHDAFTVLFGGPFVAGTAPLPNDRRLPHKELLAIGDAMGPSSVRTIALVLGQQQLDLAEVFQRADTVEMASVESTDENLQVLASLITDVMRKWRKDSSRNT
jgi:hypothetical protein